MKTLILFLILNMSVSLFAADKHFKYIKPVDNVINNALKWDDTHKAERYSDYLLWTTMAYPYLYALGQDDHRKERITTAASIQVISAFISDMVKLRAQRTRPNGKNDRSFYSGHTSAAFTNAGLICMQDKKGGYCTSALIMAASVGYLRMAADWHWFSDVIVGAGIGYVNGRYVPTLIMSF